MKQFVAIDNVCAWPNLTLLDDGTIIAVIFNQPCHGTWEGDVECWASTDGGNLWNLRGLAARHEPNTNRMNLAAGLAGDGSLIVITAGHDNTPPIGHGPDKNQIPLSNLWTCTSHDDGRSWERTDTILPINKAHPEKDKYSFIPFGDIIRKENGTLVMCVYSYPMDEDSGSYLWHSYDDGKSWTEPALIGKGNYNETACLCLGGNRWLAVIRTTKDRHMESFLSTDDGRTWKNGGIVTLPNQHPAHLLKLSNGQILLTFGIRNRGLYGVGARVSTDKGESWGHPIVLVNFEIASEDSGYPASVQLEDSTIVTAYYADKIPAHQRYHMGVILWKLEG